MIKYETIISNFDDKTTLYNWLRKVEEALKHASATNFVVNKKGNATLSFSITFADGTTLESGDIVLQQGESVDDARIASGILQLHLTNGTWLSAGNVKAVNGFHINDSQHLIVYYQDGTHDDLGAIFQGNVNIDGDLNVTGEITTPKVDGTLVTGDEIVEKMPSTYTFTQADAITGLTKEYVYAGIVKTGNKITLAVGCKLTRTAEIETIYLSIGNFVIPASLAQRIYPVNIGGSNFIDIKDVALLYNIATSKNGRAYATKTSDQLGRNVIGVNLTINDINNTLTLNATYYFRYELTILLSDNLANE